MQRALAHIDEHGLAGLSMRKLGTVLEVKGMSLYHHVANKDDLLDGVVELLWEEVEAAARPAADWPDALRTLARALRAVVRGHPNAAPLIFSQQVMPQAALRIVQAHERMLVDAGFEDARAYDLLRTLWSYAFGSAFAENTWDRPDPGCAVEVRELLRPGTPAALVAVADVFCGQSDSDAQFELGLDLMLRGLASPS